MAVWIATSVEDVPELRLGQWRVYESDEGDRHLVGYNLTEREGRVSSAVHEFDPKRRRAVTDSGRVYELVGSHGCNADAEYTWNTWKQYQPGRTYTEVTSEVASDIAAAAGEGART